MILTCLDWNGSKYCGRQIDHKVAYKAGWTFSKYGTIVGCPDHAPASAPYDYSGLIHTAWNLIGLFAYFEQQGVIVPRYEDGRMMVYPTGKRLSEWK